MKKFRKFYKPIFLICLSLTPILWFLGRNGILIDGVDTNFPLNPSYWFLRRLFVWSAVGNAGSDFSASVAGTFFHLLQFIPFKLGLPLQGVELFSLLFWFALLIFSSWIFIKTIFPDEDIPQIIFVLLYSLNIYLFNAFENVKVANLSLICSIPLGITLLIRLRQKKIGRGLAALFSILLGIILSGAGINPGYIICFFLILGIVFISEIILDFRDFILVKERFLDLLVVCGFTIIVNSFWIIPTTNFILKNISSSNSIKDIGFTNWVDSLSQNTSFTNVIRMLGAWDWYAFDSSTKLPLYIPYSTKYFYNILFIGFSFLVPALAFFSFILVKKTEKFYSITFATMLIIGVFLTSGTHPPSGVIFNFLINHVPFFSLFRSPWYIFAPMVGLSIAGLVAIFFFNLKKIKIFKKYFLIFSLIFATSTLVYAYPLILGRIFRPNSQYSFYVQFPSYVFDSGNFLDKSLDNGRVLSYPDDNIERFTWKYSGTDSILNLISDKEIVFSPLNATNSPFSQILAEIYFAIKRNEITKVESIASKLSISQIFNKRDQQSLSPDLPKELSEIQMSNFGKWNFYKIPNSNPEKIRLVSCCILSYPYSDSDKNLPIADDSEILVNPKDSLLSINNVNLIDSAIVHATNLQKEDFNNMNKNLSDLKSRIFARDITNVEYDFQIPQSGKFTPILERYHMDMLKFPNQNTILVNLDEEMKIWTITQTNDSYVYFSPIDIKAGKHKLVLPLKNNNLINYKDSSQYGNAVFSNENGTFTILNTSSQNAGLKFNMSDFDPYSYYLINFEYNHAYGDSAQVLVDQWKNNAVLKVQNQGLPDISDWQNFSFYFSPVQSDSNLNVQFAAPNSKETFGTKVGYKNISVYKVFDDDLFFKKSAPASELPEITYKKESPVSYSGEIKNSHGPLVILFNENYSPDWSLKIDGLSIKPFHFTGNYYANAWYVDNINGSHKFNIYYKPQSLLKLGYAISFIGVIIAISYFIFDKVKRKDEYK